MQQVETKKGKPFTCRQCEHQFFIDNKVRDKWKELKSPCPKCGEEYCNKPQTERILFALQEKFILTRHDFDLNKNPHLIDMYFILVDYSLSFLYKYYISKIQSNKMAKYYAENSATLIIERFLKDENFRVNDSFGGLLVSKGRKGIISQACFGKEELDIDADSLNIENEKGQQIEYADHKENPIERIEKDETTINNFKYIIGIIENIKKYCRDDFDDFARIVSLDMFFHRRSEKATDTFFSLLSEKTGKDGKIGKEMFLKTLEIIRIELENMCK